MELYKHILGKVPENNRRDSLERFLNVVKILKLKEASLKSKSSQIMSEIPSLDPVKVMKTEKSGENKEAISRSIVPAEASIKVENTNLKTKLQNKASYEIKDILELLDIPNLPIHLKEEYSERYKVVPNSHVERVKQEILDRIAEGSKTTSSKLYFRIEPEHNEEAVPLPIRRTFELRFDSSLYLSENGVTNNKPHQHWVKLSFKNELGVKKIVVEEGPLYKRCMISVSNSPQPLYDHSEFLVGNKLFLFKIQMFSVVMVCDQRQYEFELSSAVRGIITIGRSQANAIAIDDLSISRFHAEILYEDCEWVIKNVSDKNIKLFIHTKNSIEMQESSYKYKIESNEKIYIDNVAYRLILKNKHTTCDTIEDDDQPNEP